MYPTGLALVVIVYLIPTTPTVSVSICLAACYHIVVCGLFTCAEQLMDLLCLLFSLKQGIAPTLLIVRVGMGVSTDDVDTCVTISRTGAGGGLQLSDFDAPWGHNTTMQLEIRGTREDFKGRDTQFLV
jgi:hypothetical protein